MSLHYTSHTKAYNTIYTACNIVEAIYSFTHYFDNPLIGATDLALRLILGELWLILY